MAGSSGRKWMVERARLAPDLRVHTSPLARSVFQHAWAPMQALARECEALPEGLWAYLLGNGGGFAVIDSGNSRYEPGPATVRNQPVHNVAFISVEDLARENERPLHVLGHLTDHYLGCAGQASGPWFSEGGGVTAGWRVAGAKLSGLFALGYGVDAVALGGVRDYFAQSLAVYCRERQRLNVADPQIEGWMRRTLWDRSFWQAEEKPLEE